MTDIAYKTVIARDTKFDPPTEHALEQRARRRAKREGLVARKSRWRIGTIDNRGGFALINPYMNFIVAGSRYDLTAEDVLAYCADDDESVTTTKTTGE